MTKLGGRKTAQEKNQIPGNGGSQELFGPMFPWFCLFSLSFQWEEGQKFPGTLFLGTFFSYFRWFFSFRQMFFTPPGVMDIREWSFWPRTSARMTPGRPRDIRPEDFLFGLLFRSWAYKNKFSSSWGGGNVLQSVLSKTIFGGLRNWGCSGRCLFLLREMTESRQKRGGGRIVGGGSKNV